MWSSWLSSQTVKVRVISSPSAPCISSEGSAPTDAKWRAEEQSRGQEQTKCHEIRQTNAKLLLFTKYVINLHVSFGCTWGAVSYIGFSPLPQCMIAGKICFYWTFDWATTCNFVRKKKAYKWFVLLTNLTNIWGGQGDRGEKAPSINTKTLAKVHILHNFNTCKLLKWILV